MEDAMMASGKMENSMELEYLLIKMGNKERLNVGVEKRFNGLTN